MTRPVELLLLCSGITGALLTIGGVLWWLIWPRIEDKLQELASGVQRVDQKLGDDPNSVGRHARVAAGAAAELPGIRERLDDLTTRHDNTDQWRRDTDRRLDQHEGALLALLGPALRARLFTDLDDLHDRREEHRP